eukprot:CAMPEP_0184686004 /NCGR_PEP_ID=MMETSP0312-20130426/20983_1 /TAXON_ID=31354 /ORGANISM="Compsopogon coeruleus, Strain SAG 36.94" /LENGTH=370 /DNA_ID=CAMNT_0027140661 /DNA_START=86 /DNA_END=1198 /DNA_ORIENTATION=+
MGDLFKCESLTNSRYCPEFDHFGMPSLTNGTEFQEGSSFPEVLSVFDFAELVSSTGGTVSDTLPEDPFTSPFHSVLDDSQQTKLPSIAQLIHKRTMEAEVTTQPPAPAPSKKARVGEVFQFDEALSPLSSVEAPTMEHMSLTGPEVAMLPLQFSALGDIPGSSSDSMNSEEAQEYEFSLLIGSKTLHVKEQPEQSYVCQICHKTFTRHCNVIKHKRINHGIMRDYPCKQCFLSFPAKEDLDSHIRERHSLQKGTFSCGQCGATFGAKFNLNKHIRNVHEKKRPFKCPDCESTFQQKDHLNKHVQTVHEKRRPHACGLCNMSFGWRGVLNKHIQLVHQRERPFSCSVCGHNFQQKAHLDKHVRSFHEPSPL